VVIRLSICRNLSSENEVFAGLPAGTSLRLGTSDDVLVWRTKKFMFASHRSGNIAGAGPSGPPPSPPPHHVVKVATTSISSMSYDKAPDLSNALIGVMVVEHRVRFETLDIREVLG
jgi:hypothetical protein